MAVATLSSHPQRERAQCALVSTLVVSGLLQTIESVYRFCRGTKQKNLIVAKAYDEEKE